jgi:hypothetical protein
LNFFCFFFSEFEDLAIDVLKVFEMNTRDLIIDILVLRHVDAVGFDCLELARKCDCERFIGHPVVQRSIDHLWDGTLYSQKNYVITNFCLAYLSTLIFKIFKTEREATLRRAQIQEYLIPNRYS